MTLLTRSFSNELQNIFALAWPLTMAHLLRYICPFLSIMACGRSSREELDATSLACTVINVLGLSIDMGFSTAAETLFSQTFGSHNKKLLEVLLQRALMIMTLIYLTLTCVHVNIEYLLLWAGQDPLISSLTAEYILWFLPGLYCDFIFMTLSRYLGCQNCVKPMVLAAGLGAIFNVLSQIMVYKYELGLRVSASLLSVSFAIMVLCEILFIQRYRLFTTAWAELNFVAIMSDWGVFFHLGIPGLLMITLEEWCLETTTFIAGTINDVVLGSHAIAFQIQSLIYMIPLGICAAVNVRIGQALGAFDPQQARHTYMTALRSIFAFVVLIATPLALFRNQIPYLFTSDQEIVKGTVKLIPLLIVFLFGESLSGVSEAVLLASGRQVIGAVTIFAGYYLVGLPLGILLTYTYAFGIIGMWFGLAGGIFLTAFIYTFIAFKTEWREQCRRRTTEAKQSPSSLGEVAALEGLLKLRPNTQNRGIGLQFIVESRPDRRLNASEVLPAERSVNGEYLNGSSNALLDAEKCIPVVSPRTYITVHLRVAILLVVFLCFISSLWFRLFHTTPYWGHVCKSKIDGQSKANYCKMLTFSS